MVSRKYATFALINGKIVSVDKNDTVYEAVAVTGNIFTSSGREDWQ